MMKMSMPTRTLQQNKALHLYFEMLAEELNESGLDMKRTLKGDWDIPWTAENIKNHIWRPVQDIFLDKKSTTELTTSDIDRIYDIINKRLGEKFGVHVDFPSADIMTAIDIFDGTFKKGDFSRGR